jgi:hypothetical protein
MRRVTIPLGAALLTTVWLASERTSHAADAVVPDGGPPAGNPDGQCVIPPEAVAVDTTLPNVVVGDGTVPSCTGEAFIAAVARDLGAL